LGGCPVSRYLARIRRMRTWRRSICVICLMKSLRLVRVYLALGERCSNSPFVWISCEPNEKY
jgi:hypothetical protein